jgi:hypothetical protein
MSTIAKKIQLASAGAGGGDGPAALFEIDVPNSYSTFLQWDEANQQYIGSNRSNYHLKQFYGFDIEGNQTFSWEVNTGYNQYSEWNSNHSIFREDGYQSGVGAFISGSIELVSGAGRPSMVVSAQDSSATGGWDTNSFVGAIRARIFMQKEIQPLVVMWGIAMRVVSFSHPLVAVQAPTLRLLIITLVGQGKQ